MSIAPPGEQDVTALGQRRQVTGALHDLPNLLHRVIVQGSRRATAEDEVPAVLADEIGEVRVLLPIEGVEDVDAHACEVGQQLPDVAMGVQMQMGPLGVDTADELIVPRKEESADELRRQNQRVGSAKVIADIDDIDAPFQHRIDGIQIHTRQAFGDVTHEFWFEDQVGQRILILHEGVVDAGEETLDTAGGDETRVPDPGASASMSR